MGKYTAYGKKVDLEVQKQLDKICKVIIKYVNPLSIMLIGGFGRGEGSIVYKKNKFLPLNDYDIYAITSKKYSNQVIEKMCLEASVAIDKKGINFEDFTEDMVYTIEKTFYPDIRVITLPEIKKLPPFLKYYEIKNGAITIYGKDMMDKIPEFNINDVPRQDGLRFLMNRLSLMVMQTPYSSFKKVTQEDKERLVNFNMKTALSSAEALLLYSGKFVASYKKRADILNSTYKKDFSELSKKNPNLPKIINKYTQQKLKPNYDKIKDSVEDWFALRNYSNEVTKFLLFKFTGEKAKSVKEISHILNKYYYKNYVKDYISAKYKIKNKIFLSFLIYPANLVLNLLYIKRIFESKGKLCLSPLAHPFVPPDLKIFPAAFLILSSVNKKGKIDSSLFRESEKYLKQVYPNDPRIYKELSWEKMRKLYGTIFNLYGFQRII